MTQALAQIRERERETPMPRDQQQVESLRQWVANLHITHGISKASLAERIGFNRATISNFVSGRYPGSEEFLARLAELRATLGPGLGTGDEAENAAQELKDRLTYTPTMNTENIRAVAYECLNKKLMGMVIGYSGAGKTTAIEQFVSKNQERVIYIQGDPTFTAKELLREIAYAIGESPAGTARAIMRKLVGALKGKEKLLIVDEANQLVGDGRHTSTTREINTLRALYDQTRSIGILLVGTPDLLAAIMDGPPSLTQLRSRLRRVLKLSPPGTDDIERILSGFPLTPGAYAELARRARDTHNGGLRWLESTINGCIELVGPGGLITEDIIEAFDSILPD